MASVHPHPTATVDSPQRSRSRGSSAHPRQASGLFTRRGRRNPCLVGIDINLPTIRVATMGTMQSNASVKESTIRWLAHTEFNVDIDPTDPPQPGWLDAVCHTLEQSLPRCVDGDTVVAMVSLPVPWIQYRTIPIADLNHAQAQCDAMCQGSIFQSDAYLRHWPIVPGGDQQVVAAVAQSAACRIAESISKVGYRVHAVLPHGVALLHAAAALTAIDTPDLLLLEPTGSLIAVGNELGCGLCRNLPPIHHGQVERSEGRELIDVQSIMPWLEEVAQEVTVSHRYISRLGGSPDSQSPVLVCGSVMHIPGIESALASLLGRPIARWKYAGVHRPGNCLNEELDSGRAVALSLASCAASDWKEFAS